MLLVLEKSTHDTSNDVVQLFGPRLHWLLDKVSPSSPTIMNLSHCQSVPGIVGEQGVSSMCMYPTFKSLRSPPL